MITYTGNDKETYTIYKDNRYQYDLDTDEDTVIELVQRLNNL